MDTEKMAKMFQLVEKAKLYEKMGKEEMALNIYLEIHENYYPNTSLLFDRPIVLLEKRRRLIEAKEMCEKAIDLAASNKITGTPEHFQKRLDRINDKLENKEIREEKPLKKAEVKEDAVDTEALEEKKEIPPPPERIKINISEDDDMPPKSFTIFIAILTIVALVLMIRYNINSNKEREAFKDMYVDTLKMFSNTGPSKGKSIFKENPNPNIPDITNKAIEETVAEVNKLPGVLESYVMINADAIGLILKVDPLISVEDSKSASEKFAKSLSQHASTYTAEFQPADMNNYGKLYTYYSVYFLNKPNKDVIVTEGSLSKGKSKIYWKQSK